MAAVALGLVGSGAVSARTAAVDMQVDLAVGPGSAATAGQLPPAPNGGTVTVRGLTFTAGASVTLVNPETARARIRLELPSGLSWGTDLPDPSEGCTSTAATAECQTAALEPVTGGGAAGWQWDVTAAAPGNYAIRAELIDSSPADTVPSNDSSTVTVVVLPAVTAGSAALAPARPRAGATFSATVHVSAGGTAVLPTGIGCNASVRGIHLHGSAKRTSGAAICVFRTPRSAKGKVLRGSISFSAGGTKLTRRFSTTLR